MPSSKKSAAGCGTIRKKTVTKNGKDYTYWEARYTVGYDPGTGKQIQKSITGKTQGEVAKILGVSQVQVSRLENRILNSLKEKYVAK